MVKKVNAVFLGAIVLYIAAAFLTIFVPEKYLTGNFSILIGQAVYLLPVLVFLITTKFEPLRRIPHKSLNLASIILIPVITVCMEPLISLINMISALFVRNQLSDILLDMGNNPVWLNYALVALLPALGEELYMRGILYHGYRERNAFCAMLLSALLFGVFHMNINQMIYAIVLGIILVLLVEATGSLYASMLCHFTFNAISMTMLYLSDAFHPEYAGQLEQMEAVQDSAMVSIFYIFAIVVLFVLAVCGLGLGFLCYWLLCIANHTVLKMKGFVSHPFKRGMKAGTERMFDAPLIAALVLAAIFMITFEIVLPLIFWGIS